MNGGETTLKKMHKKNNGLINTFLVAPLLKPKVHVESIRVINRMDFVVLYVLGCIASIFGLIICKNRKIRALIIDIFAQEEALSSYGQYAPVGLHQGMLNGSP